MTAPTLPRALPFSWGIESAVSALVPGKYPCALDGHPLMIDDTSGGGWSHQGIQQIRTQADSSTSPSETSLNPQGLWRRAQESWHRGAGQLYRDKTNADEFRYETSKGVDPWTPYRLSLLQESSQSLSSANTNVRAEPAGARLYVADGTDVKYTTDLSNYTTVSGTSGQTVTAIASDGHNVYIGSGTSGIYKTDTTTSAAASWVTGTVSGPIAYVKGRLMAASGASIYNVTASGALPTALFTHGNSAFSWVGFAEGTANIYAAGYSGDKSLIYRIAVKPDATSLDAPIVAGSLPDGEVVTGIGGYLGFIFLGSTRGVRFCEVDGQGNLTIGPLIATGTSVRTFEGQDRFVWFGWGPYDASSSGLGRFDLTQFTEDPITGGRKPAYSSDLMVAGQADCLSVATFLERRVFTLSGLGVYAEGSDPVDTGTMDTGQIGFGLPDNKIGVELLVQTEPLPAGSYSVDLSVDGDPSTTVGSTSTVNTTISTYPLSYPEGQQFALGFTINSSGSDGPVLTRWTLKASPSANDGPAEYIVIPFLLHAVIQFPDGSELPCDVKAERDHIKQLRESRTVVAFQDVNQTYMVQIENYEWHPYRLSTSPRGGYRTEDGTLVVQMKRLS